MSAPLPGFEGEELEPDPHPRRTMLLQAVALLGLFVLVAAAVLAGLLLTWTAIQPLLPALVPVPRASPGSG